MSRADNSVRQVSTLTSVELQELNRLLRKVQFDTAKVEGRLGQAELRDSLSILAPPVDPDVSSTDASTFFYSIDEQKLMASENSGTYADVLNACAAWSSADVETGATLIWTSQLVADSSTFSWDGASKIGLMRPGLYLISWRALSTPDGGGTIRTNTVIGGTTYRNQATGVGGQITAVESIPYINTSTTPVELTLASVIGTIGSVNTAMPTLLTIVKVR